MPSASFPLIHWLAATVAAVALAAPPALRAAGQATASPPTTYRESIAGTLVSFEMVLVPGGDGIPPFYLGRTEVTWDLYDVFALGLDQKSPPGPDAVARPSRPYGAPDYGWGHAGYPAISIARDAADAFTAWLSKKTGKAYRLPTDGEWEHAARLAMGDPTALTTDDVAWYEANASGRTHPVASKKPDALGLFDLFGNAAEWVATPDGVPATRGGSYLHPRPGPAARNIQDDSWNERDPQLPKSRWWLSDAPFAGFRLARSTQ